MGHRTLLQPTLARPPCCLDPLPRLVGAPPFAQRLLASAECRRWPSLPAAAATPLPLRHHFYLLPRPLAACVTSSAVIAVRKATATGRKRLSSPTQRTPHMGSVRTEVPHFAPCHRIHRRIFLHYIQPQLHLPKQSKPHHEVPVCAAAHRAPAARRLPRGLLHRRFCEEPIDHDTRPRWVPMHLSARADALRGAYRWQPFFVCVIIITFCVIHAY